MKKLWWKWVRYGIRILSYIVHADIRLFIIVVFYLVAHRTQSISYTLLHAPGEYTYVFITVTNKQMSACLRRVRCKLHHVTEYIKHRLFISCLNGDISSRLFIWNAINFLLFSSSISLFINYKNIKLCHAS